MFVSAVEDEEQGHGHGGARDKNDGYCTLPASAGDFRVRVHSIDLLHQVRWSGLMQTAPPRG